MILRNRPLWQKLLAFVVLLFAALVIVLAFFPWDTLRGPVNRYVSEQTGRKFEITRRLDVGLGWGQATVKLDGIEFANPSWARDPYLVKADRAEFDIRAQGPHARCDLKDAVPPARPADCCLSGVK